MAKRKSTMKGKQNVSYRTCSDDFLLRLSELPKSVGHVLCELLQHIDIGDNCVQENFSDIAREKGWDRGNSSRHLTRLRKEGIVKDVMDINGEVRLMIDPRLVWSTSRDELRFSLNMFILGSHEEAYRHRQAERQSCAYIDPISGELSGEYQERAEELDWLYE